VACAHAQFGSAHGIIFFSLIVRGLICHGVVLLWSSKLTGAGSKPGVSLVLSPGRMRTEPPPPPRALRLGAGKGTKLAEAGRGVSMEEDMQRKGGEQGWEHKHSLNAPLATSVRLNCGTWSAGSLTFLKPVLEATNEKTFERPLCVRVSEGDGTE
jgi:hypothetical protein